jgi:hypothetical protein|tara:strand:+ start:164 stop:430 length:267 start_codon:yes stop_codon:yes gene_type:complete
MLKADGFDNAIIGVARQFNQPEKLVYDYSKCVEILMSRDEMSKDDAVEFMEFNVVGAYVGEQTPIWMMPMDPDLYDHVMEYLNMEQDD